METERPGRVAARTAFLARQRLFRDLPPPVLEVVASRFRPRRVRRGAFVFLEGDRATALNLLRAGRIKVIRETEAGREVIIRLIGPGEIFGGAGGWGESVYPASAVAQEDSVILHLPAAEFVRLLRTEPEFAVAVVRELGERDDEARRPGRAGGRAQRAQEALERAQAAGRQLVRERLDADAVERRGGLLRDPAREFLRGGVGVPVLLGVGAMAVAVLEVDPEVLDRLAPELLDHPGMDGPGQPDVEPEGRGEGLGVGRVLGERGERQRAQPGRRVGPEEVGTAIDGVHWLSMHCRSDRAARGKDRRWRTLPRAGFPARC